MHKDTKFSMLQHKNETFFVSMFAPVYPESMKKNIKFKIV